MLRRNSNFHPKFVAQIDKMILLVVGSAVTCPDRNHHISRILSTTDIKESNCATIELHLSIRYTAHHYIVKYQVTKLYN